MSDVRYSVNDVPGASAGDALIFVKIVGGEQGDLRGSATAPNNANNLLKAAEVCDSASAQYNSTTGTIVGPTMRAPYVLVAPFDKNLPLIYQASLKNESATATVTDPGRIVR